MSPTTSHDLLRRERLKRHWRQRDVADSVGATVVTVNRWERGTQQPSAYFCLKLCTLFGKSSQELGFFFATPKEVSAPARGDISAAEQQGSSFPSALELSSPTVPPSGADESLMDPLIPACQELIGREADLVRLKEQVCLEQGSALVALGGLPGIGKTSLAIRLASDPDIQAFFHDGILWAGLGPTPNLAGIFSRWATLLGLTASSLPADNESDRWAALLRATIGTRCLLFLLDDAWTLGDALACRVGGPRCRYLLTTRQADVAFAWTGEKTVTVHELTHEQSMQLFAMLAPRAVSMEPERVQALAHAVGGLPLAIRLLGKYLHLQTYSHQPRRLRSALQQLSVLKERYQVAQPLAPFEGPASLPACAPLSLHSAIRISEQVLDSEAQQTLHALSLFEAKPATFSEEAALAIGATSGECLDRLMDSGLLESSGPGRYMLHQVIGDYARLQATDLAEAQVRMITFFVEVVQTQQEPTALAWELPQILMAWELAWEHQWWERLLQGVLAFMPFLQDKRLYSCADLWLPRASQAAGALADQEGRARLWMWSGKMAELRGNHLQAEQAYRAGLEVVQQLTHPFLEGNLLVLLGGVLLERGAYTQAVHLLEKGLLIAQSQHDDASAILAYKNLGEVAASQGDSQQADRLFLQGLVLARRSEYWELASAFLQNLGATAERRGEYSRAAISYDQGLAYAQQCQSLQRQSAILMNQGILAFHHQQYIQALALSEESLRLARMIDNRMRMSSVLQNLGRIERVLGHMAQAESALQESLELAQAIGNRWLIGEIQGEWGAFYMQQQQLDKAHTAFHLMEREARAIDAPFLIEQAQEGLAQVEAASGRSSVPQIEVECDNVEGDGRHPDHSNGANGETFDCEIPIVKSGLPS